MLSTCSTWKTLNCLKNSGRHRRCSVTLYSRISTLRNLLHIGEELSRYFLGYIQKLGRIPAKKDESFFGISTILLLNKRASERVLLRGRYQAAAAPALPHRPRVRRRRCIPGTFSDAGWLLGGTPSMSCGHAKGFFLSVNSSSGLSVHLPACLRVGCDDDQADERASERVKE